MLCTGRVSSHRIDLLPGGCSCWCWVLGASFIARPAALGGCRPLCPSGRGLQPAIERSSLGGTGDPLRRLSRGVSCCFSIALRSTRGMEARLGRGSRAHQVLVPRLSLFACRGRPLGAQWGQRRISISHASLVLACCRLEGEGLAGRVALGCRACRRMASTLYLCVVMCGHSRSPRRSG